MQQWSVAHNQELCVKQPKSPFLASPWRSASTGGKCKKSGNHSVQLLYAARYTSWKNQPPRWPLATSVKKTNSVTLVLLTALQLESVAIKSNENSRTSSFDPYFSTKSLVIPLISLPDGFYVPLSLFPRFLDKCTLKHTPLISDLH